MTTALLIIAAVLAIGAIVTYALVIALAWTFYRLSKHATDPRTRLHARMALQAALVALFVLAAIGARAVYDVARSLPAEAAP